MNKIISLTENSDADIKIVLDKLRGIVPAYLQGKSDVNPLIQFIENKGKISYELLKYLYQSDFLSLLTEKGLLVSQYFYEKESPIGWFYLIENIYEEAGENSDEFINELFNGYQKGIPHDFCENLLEKSINDIDTFRNGISEYLHSHDSASRNITNAVDKSSVQAKEKNKSSTSQYDKVFGKLQEAHETIRKNVKQEILYKYQIDSLSKKNDMLNELIKTEREKNNDYVCRIQQMEKENEVLQNGLDTVKKELEDIRNETYIKQTDGNSENVSLQTDFDAAWENALNDVPEDEEISYRQPPDDENYFNMSFTNDVMPYLEDNSVEDSAFEEDVQQKEQEPYTYVGVADNVYDKNIIKKKSKWFLENLFGYSKKAFLNKSRKEQEGLIFIKMMELHFPMDKSKIVKDALTDLSEDISCFELYRLLCKNPTNDELMSFLGGFLKNAVNA